jgi:uncharacterized damage-inducible protein DinB
MHLPNGLHPTQSTRRHFFHAAAVAASALPSLVKAAPVADIDLNLFGPRAGYSPQLGTLVSEMIWMRQAVLNATKGMTQEQLDFLLDNKANRIGALILHLAATEKLYQLATFENVPVNHLFTSVEFKDWAVPMNLGDAARQSIKGRDLDYYLNLLQQGREKTLAEFHKRDDAWLMAVDKNWPWGPTNNLCKWFHVCEHESHHTGQISLLKSRAPGAKSEASQE